MEVKLEKEKVIFQLNKQLFLRIIDKKTKIASEEIPLEDIIFYQTDIEFNFSNGDTLPYDDFLYFRDDYEIEIFYKEEQ